MDEGSRQSELGATCGTLVFKVTIGCVVLAELRAIVHGLVHRG